MAVGDTDLADELGGESQAGAAADATDGPGGDVPQAAADRAGAGHKIYPYLLRDMEVVRPNQVWSTRYHLRAAAARVYVSDGDNGLVQPLRVVLAVVEHSGCGFLLGGIGGGFGSRRPEIFNTDQGSQFTAAAFTGRLEAAGVAISMDGRGRALDNVFVERLWRTVKYEDVYLRDYASRGTWKRAWRPTGTSTAIAAATRH